MRPRPVVVGASAPPTSRVTRILSLPNTPPMTLMGGRILPDWLSADANDTGTGTGTGTDADADVSLVQELGHLVVMSRNERQC